MTATEPTLTRGNWTDNPCFYVSVIDAGRTALVLGPFNSESECRKWAYIDTESGGVFRTAKILRDLAEKRDPRSVFYAWGMVKTAAGHRDGVLNRDVEKDGPIPVYCLDGAPIPEQPHGDSLACAGVRADRLPHSQAAPVAEKIPALALRWRLYVKFDGKGRFKPLDWRAGRTVGNLIYATVFTDADRAKAQSSINLPENAAHVFEWRPVA